MHAAWAMHSKDPALSDPSAEFLTGDEEFARLWAEPDITVGRRGQKVMRHPDAGVIAVLFDVLMPPRDPDQRLLVFRPQDDESQSALDRLFGCGAPSGSAAPSRT
ncbi:hypothetical protein [Kitasatospora sp. NPDC094016]|uniref:MmyB family transcriptional regulator n=1 Tax=Kitasatospora sp. NPDC094016 TaxID=3154986 RepID=UPI0033222D5B